MVSHLLAVSEDTIGSGPEQDANTAKTKRCEILVMVFQGLKRGRGSGYSVSSDFRVHALCFDLRQPTRCCVQMSDHGNPPRKVLSRVPTSSSIRGSFW